MINTIKSVNTPMLLERELPDGSFPIMELLELEYGIFEPEVERCTFSVESRDEDYCAGKATLERLSCNVDFARGSFSFPFTLVLPTYVSKPPVFLYISFSPAIPDKFLPVEELCDGGFAIATFDYQSITADDSNFSSPLPELFPENPEKRRVGKLAIWSWAARRIMDYLQTLPTINKEQIAVVGHSRLGKTALITAAYDPRFAAAISNQSGCCGAALHRGKQGERIEDICKQFPYWFNSDFSKWATHESLLPFDQHQLLSSLVPRLLYVSSAEQDLWADPLSEYLSCRAVSKQYEKQGLQGVVTPVTLSDAGIFSHGGRIGYHMRKGTHYLSRYDWAMFMNFLSKHWNLTINTAVL